MMHTARYNSLRLRLIFIFILLISLSINVCGDSEEAGVLIEEAAEPLVVTILDRFPSVPARSDAEILADRILRRKTDDFYFDIPKRNQLVNEIEGVLSLIRAAYPAMREIRAVDGAVPGQLVIDPERDFEKTLVELLRDKQGQIRFETGNAEFDTLNAKLGVQKVRWSVWSLSLFFDPRLNLRVAREAYSMVEGVEAVRGTPRVGDSSDIQAFKQGETWYIIFWHGWGDCPAGCMYKEPFCFTVRGTDVESIPTAQAQTMPPFQVLNLSRNNDTPFLNAPAHTWSWWDSQISDHRARSAGYDLGCPLFGEIEAFPNQLSVSCGYRVESLPRADWFSDDYDFTGVVLLLVTTQERTVDPARFAKTIEELVRVAKTAVEPVRVAKTAAEIQNPKVVYFENILMPITSPLPSSPLDRWWGAVHPTFVVCWDRPETGERAYQFIESDIMHVDEVSNHPGCDEIRDTDGIHALEVSFPLLGIRDYEIDGVLPRPAAPE